MAPFPSRAVLAVLVLLALVWHLRVRSRADAPPEAADRLLLATTGPMQQGLSTSLKAGGGLWARYLALVGVAEENARLRAQIEAAKGALVELAEVRAQNDRLRAMAELRERSPGESVAAAVIGRGVSPRFDTVRIDAGEVDGVRRGMAVVTPAGAVGQVLRASGHYADVLLVSDGLSGVGAVVQRTRLRGVAQGSGDGLRLGLVRRNDLGDVVVDDVVVTSGEDGVFPAGIALGTVTRAEEPESGLFLDVDLEPAVPLSRLEEVLVITAPPVGPMPATEEFVDPVVAPSVEAPVPPGRPWGEAVGVPSPLGQQPAVRPVGAAGAPWPAAAPLPELPAEPLAAASPALGATEPPANWLPPSPEGGAP